MITINKSTTINGNCTITDDSSTVNVAYLSASIASDGSVNISRSIQDKGAFEKYKSSVLEDFNAFDEYVYALIPLSDNASD